MRVLAASELLDVWERGQPEPPLRRALLLLAAADADTPERLLRWTVGERDAALLRLREGHFGPELASRTHCRECGEQVEFQMKSTDLLQGPSAGSDAAEFQVRHDGWEANFRLPCSLDLENLDPDAIPEENRARLLARCLNSLTCDGTEVPVERCPPEVAALVTARMAEADPHAEFRLDLLCPACGCAWQAVLDVVSFFWTELHAWATRLLREVHALALAYGWREADILAMNVGRRQFYLGLLHE